MGISSKHNGHKRVPRQWNPTDARHKCTTQRSQLPASGVGHEYEQQMRAAPAVQLTTTYTTTVRVRHCPLMFQSAAQTSAATEIFHAGGVMVTSPVSVNTYTSRLKLL